MKGTSSEPIWAPSTTGALAPTRMLAPRSSPMCRARGMVLMQCMQRTQSAVRMDSLLPSQLMHLEGQRSTTSAWMSNLPQSRPAWAPALGLNSPPT